MRVCSREDGAVIVTVTFRFVATPPATVYFLLLVAIAIIRSLYSSSKDPRMEILVSIKFNYHNLFYFCTFKSSIMWQKLWK